MLKCLFSSFVEYGILYKHPADFFNQRGTYTAVLDNKFTAISKERDDFGSMSNRSAIDLASHSNFDHTISANKIMPNSNNEDMILLINFLVCVTFMLRGGKENAN